MASLNKRQRSLFPKPLFDEDILVHEMNELGIAVDTNKRKLWRHLIQQQLPTWINDTKKIKTDSEKIALGSDATVEDIESFKPRYDNIGLPKALVKLLDTKFAVCTSKVIARTDAKDGSTTKLLIELQDGKQVEAVIMRYGHVELDCFPKDELKHMVDDKTGELLPQFKSNKRATLCVSCQVGCGMGCTFCATGTMGLVSNLTAGEIIEQIYTASKIERIRNVVFMGMGEPLDNYDAVISAINAMTDTARFGISPSRISISTVGIVPRIRDLIQDAPDVGLALSLHAPTQEKRLEIVPTAKSYHIDMILDACDQFIDNQNNRIKKNSRKRHILTEYVLIGDVNSSIEVAHQLGSLLAGRSVLLNVIPYNPTPIEYDYRTPSREEGKLFVDVVRSYGVKVLLRQTMGADVGSACGQLVVDNQKKQLNISESKKTVTDLEDIVGKKSNSTNNPTKVVRRRKLGNKEGCDSLFASFFERTKHYIQTAQLSDVLFGVGLTTIVGIMVSRSLSK